MTEPIGGDSAADAALIDAFDSVPESSAPSTAGGESSTSPTPEKGAPSEPGKPETKVETKPVEALKPPETKPATDVKPVPTPVAAKPPEPTPPTAPTTAPTPTAPAQAPIQQPSQEAVAAQMKEYETKLTTGMAQHFSTLITKEDKETLLNDPEKFAAENLPAIMAKSGMSLFYAVTHAVAQQIPSYVTNFIATREASQGAEKTLFDKFPALNKPEFRETVGKAATLWHAANPNFPDKQKAIEEIGKFASYLAGLPIGSAPSAGPAIPVAAPATPSLAPHRPMQPGAAPAAPSAPQGANFWVELSKELEAV